MTHEELMRELNRIMELIFEEPDKEKKEGKK
jgi:hypothetical protein